MLTLWLHIDFLGCLFQKSLYNFSQGMKFSDTQMALNADTHDGYYQFQTTLTEVLMKTYNRQIEDAYVGSKRQGDMMRNRNIERSSGQDRRNRYRDDLYESPPEARPFEEHNQYDDERTDRYGHERSSLYNSGQGRDQYRGAAGDRNSQSNTGRIEERVPETTSVLMKGSKKILWTDLPMINMLMHPASKYHLNLAK